jgi:hypothetical protein
VVKKSGESGESGEIEKWRNFLAKVEKFIYRICRDTSQNDFLSLEGSRALHNVRRKITPCDDCQPIIIRRRH